MRRKLATLILFGYCAATVAADYGVPLPANATPLALAAALQSPAPDQDQLISGKVGRVCQKQGCWMMLIDGDASVRVMTGHRFFLPKDASGEAVVYGRLIEREIDRKTAKHFARESGGDAVEPGPEYRIDALGMQIRP